MDPCDLSSDINDSNVLANGEGSNSIDQQSVSSVSQSAHMRTHPCASVFVRTVIG